jgi:hypothetical protein
MSLAVGSVDNAEAVPQLLHLPGEEEKRRG